MAFVMKRLTWPRMWHCCGEEEDARNGGVCSEEGGVCYCGVCHEDVNVSWCGDFFYEMCGVVVVSVVMW